MKSLYDKSKEELIEEINLLRSTVEHQKQTETKFEDLTEKSLVGVYLIRDGLFSYVNPKLAQIFGYTVDEIINKLGPKDLVHPEDKQIVEENIRKRINGEIQSSNYIFRGNKKDGSEIYIEVFGSRTMIDSEPSVVGTLLDITDKMKMELSLRDSELKYRKLFEQSPVSLWEEDFTELKLFLDVLMQSGIDDLRKYLDENPETVQKCSQMVEVINVNDAAIKLHRAKSKEELLGNLDKIFTEKSYNSFKDELIAISEGRNHFTIQGEVKTLDGETKYVIVDITNNSTLKNGEARATAILAVNDITELKSAQGTLQKSEEKFRGLFEHAPIPLWEEDLTDLQSYFNELRTKGVENFREYFTQHPNELNECIKKIKVLNVNNATVELHKANNKQQLLENLPSLFTDYSLNVFKEEICEIAEGKNFFQSYSEGKTFDDKKINIYLNSFVQTNNDEGKITSRAIVSTPDVTKQRDAERALRESEERFQRFANAAFEGIGIVVEGTIQDINNRFTELTGYSREELIGSPLMKIIYPDDRNLVDANIKGNYKEPLEFRFLRKDGSDFFVEARGVSITYKSKNARVAAIYDITDRKKAEIQLEKQKTDLALINELNEAVNRGDTLKEVINFLALKIKTTFDFVGVTIYLLGEDKKELIMQNLSLSENLKQKIEKTVGLKIPRISISTDPDSIFYEMLNDHKTKVYDNPDSIKKLIEEYAKSTLSSNKIMLGAVLKLVPAIYKLLNIKTLVQFPLISEGEFLGVFELSTRSVFSEEELVSFQKLAVQITSIIKHKIIEEAIRTSEANITSLIKWRGESIWSIDKNYNFVVINEEFRNAYKAVYDIEIMTGMNSIEILPPYLKSLWKPKYYEALSGKKVTFEFNEKIFNEVHYFDVEINPIIVDQSVTGASVISRDITDKVTAKKELIESEEKLRAVYDSAGDGITVTDLSGQIVQVNKATIKIYGSQSEKDFIGKNALDFFTLQDGRQAKETFKKILFGYSRESFEQEAVKVDGTTFPVEINSTVLHNNKGEPIGFVGVIKDITERKQSENKLIQSEENYRGLFNNATDSIYIQDADGRFLDVNEGAVKLYGYTREEFIGRTPEFLSAPGKNDLQKLEEYIKKTLNGIPQQFEFYGMRKDGTVIPKIVRLQKGKYFGKEVIIAFAMDITERKKDEARIVGLANILESSLNEIYIFDAATLNFILVNKGARNNIGYTLEELYHLSPIDIKPEFNHDSFEQLISPLRNGEKNIINFETVHRRKDGSEYPVDVHLQKTKLEDKSVFITFILDISERKKDEIALKKSEESLKLAQEFGKVGSWDWDIINDKTTWSNQAFIQMGLKPNEVGPTDEIFKNLIHPDDRELVEIAIERTFKYAEPYSVEARMIRPDGTEWIMHTVGKVIKNEKGNPIRFAGVQQDITERKLAEEEIRKLSYSVEQSPVIVLITDTDGKIEYVNPKFEEVTGYSAEEVFGENPRILKSNETSAEDYEILWKTLKSGSEWRGEFHNRKKNGELYWESATISGIKNASGKITHFVAIKEDITKRKEAEYEIAKLAKFPSEDPNPVLQITKNGKIVYSNKASAPLLKKWNYVEGETLSPEWNVFAERALKYSKIEQIEINCNDKFYSLVFSPVKESEFVNVYGLDITERKFAENILIESEEKFRNLADNSPNMIFINKDGKVVYANKVAEELTGYTKEEFYAEDFDFKKLIEDKYLNVLMRNFKSHMEGSEVPPYDYSVVTKSGKIINSIISTKLIDYGGEKAILGIITDITERKKMETALQESEAKWRSITENSPDHIMLLDRDANIIFMNRPAPGLLKKEVIGKRVYDFVPEEFHNTVRERFEEAFNVGQTQSYETKYQAGDGDFHYFSVRLEPVFKDDEVVAIVSSSTNITKEKKNEIRLKKSYLRLQKLAEKLQFVREEERASVAREIHDDLGQSLTALKMDVAWLKKNPEMSEEEKNNKIETMLNLTDSTIQTVKRIATELRPGILDDLGLVPAIEWQTVEFQNRFKIKCNLTINKKDVILKDDVSVAVFRIFQETLTNVARHSGATEININLNFNDNRELLLDIVDNGKGINKEEIYSLKSLGLFGMKERIDILKGKLRIEGEPNKGTKVSVIVPY